MEPSLRPPDADFPPPMPESAPMSSLGPLGKRSRGWAQGFGVLGVQGSGFRRVSTQKVSWLKGSGVKVQVLKFGGVRFGVYGFKAPTPKP